MNKSIALASTAAFLMLSPYVYAQNNFYVGLDIYKSKVELSDTLKKIESSTNEDIEDEESGVGLVIGYQYNPWVSIELGYSRQYLDIVDQESQPTPFGIEYTLFRGTRNSFSISPKFQYLMNNGFSLYAKPGLGYTVMDLEMDGNSLLLGKIEFDQENKTTHFNLEVGADYFVSDSLSVGVSYERQFDAIDYSIGALKTDKMSIDLLKASVKYHF